MTEKRREKLLQVLARRRPGLTLVLEDIHDAHNVSAVLRSADAVGVMGVHLVYTRSPFPKLGKKSSASATKWVRRTKHPSVAECFAALRGEGFRILSTRLGSVRGKESLSLYDLDLTGKIAFVFGNEHLGVSDDAAALSDLNFHIPMSGMIESLNVSVACAVTLYEAHRQRTLAGEGPLTAAEKKALEELGREWLAPPARRR